MFSLSLTILHIHGGATRTHMFAWPLHQNVMLCDTKQGVGDSFYQIYCCCSSQWVRWAVNGGWSMETVLIIHPVSRLTLVTLDADATSGFYTEWRVDFHQDIIDSSCHYKYSSTFWKEKSPTEDMTSWWRFIHFPQPSLKLHYRFSPRKFILNICFLSPPSINFIDHRYTLVHLYNMLIW